MKTIKFFTATLMLLIYYPMNLMAQEFYETEPNNDLINNYNPIVQSNGSYIGAVPWSANDIDIWKIKPGSAGTLSYSLLLTPDGSQVWRGLYESNFSNNLGTFIGNGGNVNLSPDKYYFLVTEALEPIIPGAGNYYAWQLSGNVVYPQNPGDANCDGLVNVLDVIGIANFILGLNPQPFCFDNADVNNDGLVNVLDVTGTVNIILCGGAFVCGTSTITDADGNMYNTILIGSQCWMKENLKTTHYNNGTLIEYPGNNNSAWLNNTSGAFAWYNNDASWKNPYGALYNWYAITNANGLCPVEGGWHVPDANELAQLTNFIGGTGSPLGNLLKSCRQLNSPLGGNCNTSEHPFWNSNQTHYGTDDYGFSGFPGGYRFVSGGYENINNYGAWWTTHEMDPTLAWGFGLIYNHGSVDLGKYNKKMGLSVRCLKNN